MRYKSSIAATITTVDILVGTNATTGYESTTVLFLSDSSSVNTPFRIIDTFTPTSVVGTGSTTVVRYSGTHSIGIGEKFWLAPNAPTSMYAVCYKNLSDASPLVMNGLAVDTSTSVTLPYRATSTVPLRNTSSWNANQAQGYFQAEIQGDPISTQSSVSVILVSGLNVTTFRSTAGSALRATTSVEGKVTFFQNGKRIAGCIKIPTASLVATCTWKPTLHLTSQIYATLQPNDGSFSISASPFIQVSTTARSNLR